MYAVASARFGAPASGARAAEIAPAARGNPGRGAAYRFAVNTEFNTAAAAAVRRASGRIGAAAGAAAGGSTRPGSAGPVGGLVTRPDPVHGMHAALIPKMN